MPDECFFISPIGPRSSTVRERSDEVMEILLRSQLEPRGYVIRRADHISDLGRIDDQVIDHLLNAELAVCDLTGLNANVMYELGVRHMVGKPVITIAEEGTSLPFDMASLRTIFFSLSSASLMHEAQQRLSEMADRILETGYMANPVMERANRNALEETGGLVETALMRIESGITQVLRNLEEKDEGLREAQFALNNGNFEDALQKYESLLSRDPYNIQALLGLAKAQRRLHMYQRAVDTLRVLIEKEPWNPQGRYNLACYLCLAGYDEADVLKELSQAIGITERYRRYAATDPDFLRLAKSTSFVDLLGGGNLGMNTSSGEG